MMINVKKRNVTLFLPQNEEQLYKNKKLHILEFTESAFKAIDIVIKLVCKLKLCSHYYSDVICDMKMLS